MIRTIFGKVMWVGRATVFTVGLVVVLALMLGVATTAIAAAPGDPFRLGKGNFVKKLTALKSNAKSATLRLINGRSGAALDLRVKQGEPPMKVNSDTQVENLNADKLDGEDSGAFLQNLSGYEIVTASSVYNAASLKSATAYCPSGKRVVSGGARYSDEAVGISRGSGNEVAIQGNGPTFSIDDRWTASADWMGGSGSTPFDWRVIAYAICANE